MSLGVGLAARLESAPPRLDAAALTMPSAPAAVPASSAQLFDDHSLKLPDGAPAGLGCAEAQRVAQFLSRELAAPLIAPTAPELSSRWRTLMDPHGMWSACPDCPVADELFRSAEDMLRELQDPALPCAAAERVAQRFDEWLSELGALYDEAFESARGGAPPSVSAVYDLVADPIFEDDPVSRRGRELSRELGRRAGAFVARFPAEAALVEAARSRFLPQGSSKLVDIAILSALRSYVPLVDPHGDFAVLDEEWALYAGDSTLDLGSPLWGDAARTPLGARVVADPARPLELDDVVLAINGLTLAGASVEQIEQAARTRGSDGSVTLRVLRRGERELLSFAVEVEAPEPEGGLRVEQVRFGAGKQVLRIVVPDVGDDLGEQLEATLLREAGRSEAVLLDLRGNGGGSLDAAVDALGLLLPGVPLFPLVHRGNVTEVLHAPHKPSPYRGPVAALIDGDTASAAEMLAGALQAYSRGMLVGARTFGKGCVQEYFDQVAPAGVLRMTTLQFVMPDGRPLQQIGLTPELPLPLPPALEREAHIARQPITFDGPDVRDRSIPAGPAWPRDSAAAGPCEDPVVCSAISRLATAGAPRLRAKQARAGTR